MRPIEDPVHRATAEAAADVGLCAHCLGRTLAKVDTGLSNDQRGEFLAKAHGLALVGTADCHVCEGLFDRVEDLVDLVEETLEPIEFDSFLVGTRVSHATTERDELVWAACGTEHAETLTSELNREIGGRLYRRHERDDEPWNVDFKRPEVTALVDTRFDHVSLTYRSLCLYGRYRKLSREIPQTKWPCGKCRGSGCHQCEMTGQQYQSSVEALIEPKALEASGATTASFHGGGREDIDAMCLGKGRPFVLELADPQRRALDLDALTEAINAHAAPDVEVHNLQSVPKEAIAVVKGHRGGKSYEADVAFDSAVAPETLLTACGMLAQAQVAQRTPSRVSHRRADKVRRRRVASVQVQSHGSDGRTARLRIEGDAGLYIKELLNGDDGRTDPSLAKLVGTGTRCTALDVVDVEGPEDPETGQYRPEE